jgi:hypothetical protein
MATTLSLFSIEEEDCFEKFSVFRGTNYPYWKARTETYIQSCDYTVWMFLANETNPSDFKLEYKLNIKALNFLQQAIDSNILNKLSSHESAKIIWSELENIYGSCRPVCLSNNTSAKILARNTCLDNEQALDDMRPSTSKGDSHHKSISETSFNEVSSINDTTCSAKRKVNTTWSDDEDEDESISTMEDYDNPNEVTSETPSQVELLDTISELLNDLKKVRSTNSTLEREIASLSLAHNEMRLENNSLRETNNKLLSEIESLKTKTKEDLEKSLGQESKQLQLNKIEKSICQNKTLEHQKSHVRLNPKVLGNQENHFNKKSTFLKPKETAYNKSTTQYCRRNSLARETHKPSRRQNKVSVVNTHPHITCHYCNLQGHYKFHCPSRKVVGQTLVWVPKSNDTCKTNIKELNHVWVPKDKPKSFIEKIPLKSTLSTRNMNLFNDKGKTPRKNVTENTSRTFNLIGKENHHMNSKYKMETSKTLHRDKMWTIIPKR